MRDRTMLRLGDLLQQALLVLGREGRHAAHRLDALLLLYREDGLPRQAVESAVRRLRQSGAKLVGTILNAARATASDEGGYYGAAYGSHYYAPDDQKAALPSRRSRRPVGEEVA